MSNGFEDRGLSREAVEKDQAASESRRNFLRLAALGAPVAVVASATGASAETVAPKADGGAGYRETAHVKQYLETARF